MLSDEGLDPGGWIPFLKKIRLIGLILRANKNTRSAYKQLTQDSNFNNALKYADLKVDDFIQVSKDDPDYKLKTSGTSSDSINDSSPDFVVQDGNYLSARWPGDVHTLGLKFVELLK